MSSTSGTRLLIPSLAGLYAILVPLADLLLRVAIGGTLLVHGINKLQSGPVPVIASMARLHVEPAAPFGYWIIFLETVGALCVMLGFFTRFFATCIAIEIAVIAYFAIPHGFAASKGGYESLMLWSLMFVVVAFRGAGAYSVDHAIGREL